jgi:hypothetical protein
VNAPSRLDFGSLARFGKQAGPDGVIRCDCGAEIDPARWMCDPCRAEAEERARQKRVEEERARMRARAERGPTTGPAWEGARVGAPTFEQWVRPKSFRLAAVKWKPEGNLVLLGPTGCGKSTTALALLWRLADDAVRACIEKRSGRELDITGGALWCAAYELVRARKEHPLGRGEAQVVEQARDASILVLDDLGNEPLDTVIFEILDVRYQRGAPVIVTSGLDPSSIRERYGDALWRPGGARSVSDGAPPFSLQVMHAVARSDLPPELRHFVMTLALLANSDTGSAYYGQSAIAGAMGVSDRQVRTYFRALEALPASPVRVSRRRRGAPDGKGRSSDEWQLVLFPEHLNRNHASASDDSSTGSQLPPETPSTGSPLPFQLTPPGRAQPEGCDSSTGSLEQLNRKPTSGDRRSDRRSDRRREDPRERGVFEEWASKLWKKVHKTGDPRPTEKRLRHFRARLQDGTTPEELSTVFDKVAASEFHVSGGYIEPHTIVPTREKVEWWLARKGQPSTNARRVQVQRGVMDEDEARSWGQSGAQALAGDAQ